MESYNIVNIQEIETFKKGESYKGEITVFTSDIGPKFLLFGNKSVYLNAFSYMLVLSEEPRFWSIAWNTQLTLIHCASCPTAPHKFSSSKP